MSNLYDPLNFDPAASIVVNTHRDLFSYLENYEKDYNEVELWLLQNCIGEFALRAGPVTLYGYVVYFEFDSDATLFSLRWVQ